MDLASSSASTVSDVAFTASGQALVALYEPGGLYRSVDGGQTWGWLGQGLASLTPLALLPDGPDGCLWVGTVDGIRAVCEEGTVLIAGAQGPVYSLARGSEGVWAAAESGLLSCSQDGCLPPTLSCPALGVDSTPGLSCAGTAGEGLWCSGEAHGTWWRAEAPLATVNDLALGEGGSIHVVSAGGLYSCDSQGMSCIQVPLPHGAQARVLARDGDVLLVGTAGGGIFSTDDSGVTWEAAAGPRRWPEVSALAIGPKGAGLAGTVGAGLLYSGDGGSSWEVLLQAPGKRPVFSLAAADDGSIYAGTGTGVYGAAAPGGPWRALEGEGAPGATYALAWAGGYLYAGSAEGVHRADREGRWALVTEELGRQTVFALVADGGDVSRLYAGSWGNNVLSSADAGSTWAPVHHGLETLSVHSLTISPYDPARQYVGTVEGVFRTQDSGRTWEPCGPAPETVFALVYSLEAECTLFAGTTTGAWRTDNCGDSWERLELPGPVTVYSLLIPSGRSGTLLAGTEKRGVWASFDQGESWQRLGLEGGSVYSLYCTPDGELLAGTDDGLYGAGL